VTRRALLWCGWADPARVLDFPASVKDLDLAVRAARALGVRDMDMHAFLSHADLISGPEVSQYAATIDALERVVASLAREATADDALLFIATNHGEQLGLLTSGPVDEFSSDEDMPRHLSPAILRQCLDKIPGTQVLIFATCHAGVFLPLAHENRAVLASCAADQVYLVQEDPPCSPFLIEFFKAWCSIELPGYQTVFSEGVLELDAAFLQAEQRLSQGDYPAEYKKLRPLRQGTARWPQPR